MNTIFNAIIIHFDEIGLKGKNQAFFVRHLIQNLEKKFKVRVKSGAKKIIMPWPRGCDWVFMAEQLSLTPGIAFFAPAIICPTSLKNIKSKVKTVIEFYNPKTFRFSARRADKDFELDSMQLSAELGEFVLEVRPDLKVSLKEADLEIRIEVEKQQTAILGRKEAGLGGLAVGSTGEVLCLLSGGFDSPVAAFMMMKRGAHVNFIHFQNKTINASSVADKIKDLVSVLSGIQGKAKLFIVPFADLQKEVITNIESRVRMIIYRRLMYKIAERVANIEGALALVTGDSLGQVASQTLENLSTIASATNLLKLAPLVGMNKNEIIQLSQKIGAYDISVRPYGDCCNLLVAKHPETSSQLMTIEKVESQINFQRLIDEAINNIQTYTI